MLLQRGIVILPMWLILMDEALARSFTLLARSLNSINNV